MVGLPQPDLGSVPWKARCFAGLGKGVQTPDYDQFSHYYRSLLAPMLASKFGLKAPNALWDLVDVFNGVTSTQSSGDFASCSKWGARTLDLPTNGSGKKQIEACFAAPQSKKTLVIMTVGGNDFASLAKQGMAGTDKATLMSQIDDAIAQLSGAIGELQDPVRFPAGSYIVLANVYEFTDGTRDEMACAAAGAAGFNKAWADGPAVFAYLDEQIVKTAVQKNVDVVFMEENFCGHGFKAADPAAPCYRGPNTPLWFDPITCIHPNTAGHAALAEMFFQVVSP
jgi:lysophospholipase L1-like esterase